jgi:periplasmic divalent cation tolerance protein
MTNVVLVLTTVPDGELGDAMARKLVEERLAACVNVMPPMTSFYRWQGALEREVERQIVIKTTAERVPAVQARVAELHPYELPEFVVLAVADGSTGYMAWVGSQTTDA